MSSCVCSNIRRAARVVTRLYDEALAPCGLKVMQLEALDTLTDLGPATLTELAKANAHERSAVWRGLQPLLARELVRVSGADGRADRYEITEAGTHVMQDAVARWRIVQDRVLAGLGEEHGHLMSIVGKLDAIAA